MQQPDDQSVLYAKENKKEFLNDLIIQNEPSDTKTAIFMAGTPGAGKTEFATTLQEMLGASLSIIDADAFRVKFPLYNGTNSSEFQRGASWLVDYAFTELIHKNYSFILDGTFAFNRASQNIERVLNRNYRATLYFVYQKPETAWRFIKARETNQGRKVPKEAFIKAYENARKNVEEVKKRFGNQIRLVVVFKDFEKNISDIVFDASSLKLVLPPEVSRKDLEERLDG